MLDDRLNHGSCLCFYAYLGAHNVYYVKLSIGTHTILIIIWVFVQWPLLFYLLAIALNVCVLLFNLGRIIKLPNRRSKTGRDCCYHHSNGGG